MEAMRESWTDERLDDFRTDVNRQFDEVKGDMNRRFGEFDKRFDKVDHELHRINDRLDGLGKAVIFGAFTLSTSYLAGFIVVAFGS
jgi:glutaredoxin 2